jgi:hypothetical protein
MWRMNHTPSDIWNANAGQASKFLQNQDQDYTIEHLRLGLSNAFRIIDRLERRIATFEQKSK